MRRDISAARHLRPVEQPEPETSNEAPYASQETLKERYWRELREARAARVASVLALTDENYDAVTSEGSTVVVLTADWTQAGSNAVKFMQEDDNRGANKYAKVNLSHPDTEDLQEKFAAEINKGLPLFLRIEAGEVVQRVRGFSYKLDERLSRK